MNAGFASRRSRVRIPLGPPKNGYIENYLKAVRSWLEYNEVGLVRRIKIGNRNLTPSIAGERVPTKDELRQILSYAGDRGRCSIALMAFSGLRPEILGNASGWT